MEPKKQSATERFVRDLMPGSTEAEIEEAISNFQEYLLVVKEIADRLEREGKEIVRDEEIKMP